MPKTSKPFYLSKTTRFIKKPKGRPGPKTWTLIKELGLENDKAQYNAIQGYVRKKTQRYCNTSKGIQSQDIRDIVRVIDKAYNKFNFLRNYENAWPIMELMKRYLANSAYQSKRNGNSSDDDSSEDDSSNSDSSDNNPSNADTRSGHNSKTEGDEDEDVAEGVVKQSQKVGAMNGKIKGVPPSATATHRASKNDDMLDMTDPLADHHGCEPANNAKECSSSESVIKGGATNKRKTTARPRSKQDTSIARQNDLHASALKRKADGDPDPLVEAMAAALGGDPGVEESISETVKRKAKRAKVPPKESRKPRGTRQLKQTR